MKLSNLINKKFGKLTVLEQDGISPTGHVKWKCICECGNKTTRTGTSLIRSKFSSCGCWSRFGKDSPSWKGVGEISAGWFCNIILRSRSKRKNRNKIREKINISLKYIWELFLKQNRKCALSGIELTFPKKENNIERKKATASLDRIDSSKGYIKGNVQWVHKDINRMKNIYNECYFIDFCKKVSEFRK